MKRIVGTLVLFVLLILTVAAIISLDGADSTNAAALRQNRTSSISQ